MNEFWGAALGAVKINEMILIMVIGAPYLSVVIGYFVIPNQLTEFVASMRITCIQLTIILTIMYIFPGTLLDDCLTGFPRKFLPQGYGVITLDNKERLMD
ncbi:hypothetical protein [Virgibacillus kimchii]